MKQRFEKSVGGLVIVGLPLMLIAGCAANKAHLAQIDPQTTQVEEQVKTLLDQAAVPAVESAATPGDQTEPQLITDETTNENVAKASQESETTAPPEVEVSTSPELVASESTEAEASVPSEKEARASTPVETIVAANDESAPDEGQTPEKAAVPLPQQMVFYFGFNQDEISAADRAIVKQHADYLLAHPEYSLLITGHTDNRGPKTYNQRLSETRADKVAQLLEADGVPKEQLLISAMGASVPMVDPANYEQNRRVEFTYQDAVMAKNQ